jgi:hypothetical protein
MTAAAEDQHAGAQHNLGVMYLRGDGVNRDVREAIVDDEQRRDRPQSPCSLRIPAAAGASAVVALLDDAIASPASRRLASAPAALGTRPIVL